jgi:ketosteroid isomerase-like protein
MTPHEQSNLETVRAYFRVLETYTDAAQVAHFYHPEIVQEEFPNLFLPKGMTRNLDTLVEGAALLSARRYEILNEMAFGDWVAVEFLWQGTLAIDAGPLKKGQVMTTHSASFIQLRDGKIIAQRSYDCYEPLSS